MSFGREKAWLGAALAAFGVGCGEPGNAEKEQGDVNDIKDAKIEKAPEGSVNRQSDPDFFVPDEKEVGRRIDIVGVDSDTEIETNAEIKIGEIEQKSIIEKEKEFRNALMEEADSKRPGDWMGDNYEAEVARLKEKLPKELWKNKFNSSPEQLVKFFTSRAKKTEKNGVRCLVKKNKEGKFFINREYRDKVKALVEKYSAKYDVPVDIIYGLIAVENGGKHDPRKNLADGAYGIMQVQPGVVDHLQKRKFNGEDWKGVSVADLEGNIRAGVAYFKFLDQRYGGKQRWAPLMAYNAGPAAFERDMMSWSSGGLSERAKLKKDIRDLKKQIKYENEQKETNEDTIRLLEEKLKTKKEELSVQNERLNQLRVGVVKGDGWEVFFSEKNLWWACSKFGGTLCANSNASYAVNTMYLTRPMQEIMEAGGGEVKLTPLVKEEKKK